jgi:hypothetical protein
VRTALALSIRSNSQYSCDDRVLFAALTPRFHVAVHTSPCAYHPPIRVTDGEGVERAWLLNNHRDKEMPRLVPDRVPPLIPQGATARVSASVSVLTFSSIKSLPGQIVVVIILSARRSARRIYSYSVVPSLEWIVKILFE